MQGNTFGRVFRVTAAGESYGPALQIIVDGVQIGGLVRFELIAQKGYKRVTAVVDMNYDKEDDQQLHAELAGTPVCGDDGKPLTITVDVFRRA